MRRGCIGGHDETGKRTRFPAALGHGHHVRILPAARTYQSDVETAHRFEEDEFFDLESFFSYGDFFAETTATSFSSTWCAPAHAKKT